VVYALRAGHEQVERDTRFEIAVYQVVEEAEHDDSVVFGVDHSHTGAGVRQFEADTDTG
jgi:hypothetical protein